MGIFSAIVSPIVKTTLGRREDEVTTKPDRLTGNNRLYNHPIKGRAAKCESGGIGRRTRLRIWRVKPWGFESPLSHHVFQNPRSSDRSGFHINESLLEP
jgi:hypothetical protein